MVKTLSTDDFLATSVNGVIIDVRTPAEFELGHIIGAVNIPLFSNDERATVGTIYKQIGRDEAVEKGLEFVGLRLAELVRTAKKISGGKPLFLYCWRGGMRSGSMAWLLSTAGLNVSLLKGGYKVYRHRFEEMLQHIDWKIILLSGATGCGKTELLHHLKQKGEQVLDLEALANHKGSAFGGMGQLQQPTTEHFINILHDNIRKFDPAKRVWCEGESMLIGHVFLPQLLYNHMRNSTIVEITMDLEQRLDRLMIEYGSFSTDMLTASFLKIQKRLGTEHTKEALDALQNNDIRKAARIALWYYDKAYTKSGSAEARKDVVTFMADNKDMQNSATRLLELMSEPCATI